jgi:hypothetical protein
MPAGKFLTGFVSRTPPFRPRISSRPASARGGAWGRRVEWEGPSLSRRLLDVLSIGLSWLPDDSLERAYRVARDLQHRAEDGWFRREDTFEWQRCRLASTDWCDPIMEMSGCAGEFARDFRRKDLRDGCPHCSESVLENASEPDVLARWGLR